VKAGIVPIRGSNSPADAFSTKWPFAMNGSVQPAAVALLMWNMRRRHSSHS
jgi:hypothetical protein